MTVFESSIRAFPYQSLYLLKVSPGDIPFCRFTEWLPLTPEDLDVWVTIDHIYSSA